MSGGLLAGWLPMAAPAGWQREPEGAERGRSGGRACEFQRTVDGVARAPAVLREHGASAALAGRPGFIDAGDLALPVPNSRRGPSGLRAEDALITMIGRVAGAVRSARSRGCFPRVLGGDGPVMLGVLAALPDERGPAWPAVRRRARGCMAAADVAGRL